jgi:hypothetical protein
MRKYVVAGLLAVCLFPSPAAGQFGKMARKKLNGLFTARVDFSKMSVSFLRKFPRTYLVLEDFRMIGTGRFEGDTLVACRKATATFGLGSVIRRKHIKIKSVVLETPQVYAHVLADGQANWQILKRQAPPENVSPQPEPAPKRPPGSRRKPKKTRPRAKVSVGRIEICNADLLFCNDRQRALVSTGGLDLLILREGAGQDSVAEWTVQVYAGDLDLRTGNHDRLQDVRVGLASIIHAAPDHRMFGMEGCLLRINDMDIRLNGSAGKRDSGWVTDLSFASENAGFKRLLSLFPAVRRQADFEHLQTAGRLAFDGYVKGTFNRQQKPVAALHLQLDSALLRYPRLPEPVDRIRLAVNLLYDGAAFDRSTFDLDGLHFELGGRPFDLHLHLQTPQSDLQVAGAMKGMIRLDSLAYAIPLPRDMQLTGFMECDLSLNGRMSALERDSFDGFHAQGMLELNGITLTNPRFPEGVDVPNLSVNFTPRVVKMLKNIQGFKNSKNEPFESLND